MKRLIPHQKVTESGEKPSLALLEVLDELVSKVETLEGSVGSSYHRLALAEGEIKSTYGDTVSISTKAKTLLKFGSNDSIGTSLDTVWAYGGNETYATTNSITMVSSSDAGDAIVKKVEGHTVSGSGADAQYTFVIQDVTFNGQTPVLLATPLARVSRAASTESISAGDLYVFETDTTTAGVPDTPSKVHLKVPAGETRSFKCATTFSNTDYALITSLFASIQKKTTATVNLQLEVRTPGGVFYPVSGRIALSSAGQSSGQFNFDPCIIVPRNSDVRVRAIASTTAVEVDASIQAYLAAVV